MASQGLAARMSALLGKLYPFVRVQKSGAQTAVALSGRFYNTTGQTLAVDKVVASLGTAPAGSTFIVDANKNGTTIFTTQTARPTIAIAGFKSTGGVPLAAVTLADGDYLSFDVDQIGSGTAGSDLVVEVFTHIA
jgi:hypothetical protein